MNERIADRLDRKYRIALAVVAVLVLGKRQWRGHLTRPAEPGF
jgi:hypothetical protein